MMLNLFDTIPRGFFNENCGMISLALKVFKFWGTIKMNYRCPCCGYYTFPVPREDAIAYICPVCFWENDVFTSHDDEPSDANGGHTLNEGRTNFKKFGACTQDMLIHVRQPKVDELEGRE